MPYIDYACQGRLLFRTRYNGGRQEVPRIDEIVVLDERPYRVVDVEYWARREGNGEPLTTWPTVYLMVVDPEDWRRRMERRRQGQEESELPLRY